MFRALKMLVSVPAIMACTTAGTVGLLKIIKKIAPDEFFPKDQYHSNTDEKEQ